MRSIRITYSTLMSICPVRFEKVRTAEIQPSAVTSPTSDPNANFASTSHSEINSALRKRPSASAAVLANVLGNGSAPRCRATDRLTGAKLNFIITLIQYCNGDKDWWRRADCSTSDAPINSATEEDLGGAIVVRCPINVLFAQP
ncbi:unnamed protein product, partial [Iphiclides podalirius]